MTLSDGLKILTIIILGAILVQLIRLARIERQIVESEKQSLDRINQQIILLKEQNLLLDILSARVAVLNRTISDASNGLVPMFVIRGRGAKN